MLPVDPGHRAGRQPLIPGEAVQRQSVIWDGPLEDRAR